ncbi:Transmembrane protein 62 [Tritrichomonas musculus]|uniref:Transmembrane protein 62 n=1 Tax=Tritrichomonas musculus TaxID=1915356 RepID=A0ABR2J3K5_9EUKA
MLQDKVKAKFNVIPYYISQYSWILFILFPFMFSVLFPKKTKEIKIDSSRSLMNNSIDPIIFAHVSDVHINSLHLNSINSFKKTFNVIKNISPEFVVLTGDIVDNYDSLKIPRYGEQNEESWKIYKKELNNFKDIPVIEVAGNHDMFGIKSVLSSKNYFLDSSQSFNRDNIKSIDDFMIHSFKVGKSNTNIITINPFHFPTPHPPLLLYKEFSTKLLDLLNNEISKSPNKSIVICHYPIGSIHSSKSSKGLKFIDLISSTKSVHLFLSGHSHPQNSKIYHHDKRIVEILGVSSLQQSKFGLVSIDNGGISCTLINSMNQPKGVITYPIPKEQLSSNSIFNDIENSEIRVVVFSNRENLSIKFNISENTNSKLIYSGNLNYSRKLQNNHSLYTFPLNKCITNKGSYNITFSGDFDGHVEFIIDDSINAGGEILTECPRIINMLKMTFPIIAIILLIIIIPFNCKICNSFQSRLNHVEEWIETSNLNEEKIIYNWLYVIFCGILLIRTRFQRNNIIIRLFVFISVIYCFFGPMFFFKTEDLVGFVWTYGYFIDNQSINSDYGIFYSYFYLGIVCTPMILICSSFGIKTFSKYQIVDIIFFWISIFGDSIVLIRIIHQTTGSKFVFTSIGFIYIPLLFIILIINSLILTICNKNKDELNGIADINEETTSN